ncbi:hypothetical protein J3D43_005990 [Paenibacillus xylanexedens]|nr:hypothetical protein [Paenibacillus xylanexedens]MCP1427474.1 hypothetical protein [Paenibacillus xylanexedens]
MSSNLHLMEADRPQYADFVQIGNIQHRNAAIVGFGYEQTLTIRSGG